MSISPVRDDALLESIRRIAIDVASVHADDVDRRARFPSETIEALRSERALSASIPEQYGGEDASIEALATGCLELGRHCAASAMVFAMHHIQLLTIVRHHDDEPWFTNYLEQVSAQQRLIGSVTSEVGTGGDMGRSVAPVERLGNGRSHFEKRATTVSYGAYADDLLTTLRRSPDAEPGDQVSVVTMRGQHSLEPTGTWDVLGMRGTCSPGCVVGAEFADEQVLPAGFATQAAESMVPVSHILWSHLWLGIAEDAFARAKAYVRNEAKRRSDNSAVSAQRLSRMLSELCLLRAEVRGTLAEYARTVAEDDRERLATFGSALRFNNLKIAASEQTVKICHSALDICGISGFRNDSPFSVGRHLRDSLSAPLMIANDRIRETNANLLLIAKEV